MIGDRPIALLAFLAAALLHLVVLVLASYMPIAKLERPVPPSPTRYVVQFQPPAPTTPPTPVPMPPAPPSLPVLPVPGPVPPRPKQPSQAPQPPTIEVQRPEPLPKPVERPAQPKPPAPPQEPVRVRPHPKPIRQVKRPERVAARKPADVKVRQAPRTDPPTPSAPSQPIAPREPVAPHVPTPQQWVPPTAPPPEPTAPPVQDLQRQYLAMVSKALQHHKRYPRVARRRGLSGKVVLAFVILPNGQVTETRIVASQSTRHGMLHKAALRALEQASPLPPFPKALKKPSLRVTLPILYELRER